MANKKEKIEIKNFLKNLIFKEDNIRFYFIKKSKVSPQLEYKIPYKTKKTTSVKKLKTLQKQLQNDTGVAWDFIRWSDIIGELLPESKVYKTHLTFKT